MELVYLSHNLSPDFLPLDLGLYQSLIIHDENAEIIESYLRNPKKFNLIVTVSNVKKNQLLSFIVKPAA